MPHSVEPVGSQPLDRLGRDWAYNQNIQGDYLYGLFLVYLSGINHLSVTFLLNH